MRNCIDKWIIGLQLNIAHGSCNNGLAIGWIFVSFILVFIFRFCYTRLYNWFCLSAKLCTHTERLIAWFFFGKALLSQLPQETTIHLSKIIFITQNWHYYVLPHISTYKPCIMHTECWINSIISVWFTWNFFFAETKQQNRFHFYCPCFFYYAYSRGRSLLIRVHIALKHFFSHNKHPFPWSFSNEIVFGNQANFSDRFALKRQKLLQWKNTGENVS